MAAYGESALAAVTTHSPRQSRVGTHATSLAPAAQLRRRDVTALAPNQW
jgi:hypothetical protein